MTEKSKALAPRLLPEKPSTPLGLGTENTTGNTHQTMISMILEIGDQWTVEPGHQTKKENKETELRVWVSLHWGV